MIKNCFKIIREIRVLEIGFNRLVHRSDSDIIAWFTEHGQIYNSKRLYFLFPSIDINSKRESTTRSGFWVWDTKNDIYYNNNIIVYFFVLNLK